MHSDSCRITFEITHRRTELSLFFVFPFRFIIFSDLLTLRGFVWIGFGFVGELSKLVNVIGVLQPKAYQFSSQSKLNIYFIWIIFLSRYPVLFVPFIVFFCFPFLFVFRPELFYFQLGNNEFLSPSLCVFLFSLLWS